MAKQKTTLKLSWTSEYQGSEVPNNIESQLYKQIQSSLPTINHLHLNRLRIQPVSLALVMNSFNFKSIKLSKIASTNSGFIYISRAASKLVHF